MDHRRSESTRRLRDLTRVAYTAAAGHLEVDPEEGEDRAVRAWPSRRAVVAVIVVLALVVTALGARYLLSRPGAGEELGASGADAERAAVASDELPGSSTDGEDPGAPGGGGSAEDGGTGAEESGSGAAGTDTAGNGTGGPDGTGNADGTGQAGADGTGSADGTGETGAGGTGQPGASGGADAGADVVVHVAGAVVRPGLVALPPGARVGDAVDASGGALADADLTLVNLARPLVDGEQVYVPVVGEEPREPPAAPPDQQAGPGSAGAPGGTGSGAGPGAGADPGGSGGSGVVDLNLAGEAELETLPGIGPALAGRITAHREEIGGFTSVDELDDVSGIGPVLMEQLRDLVTV
ncbi:ComEA family DNA-binding protein [Georgenia sp. Z1344]|uniref:ComEA family DNA-binding protein n=1 Tax=Georgenia sp. Z1344 TaxID=3416706 RepID=UPI003CE7F3CB